MKEKELEFILKQGEGQLIEFKESLSGIDKEIVAFDNRIQISNIGSLIPPLNKDNLGEVVVRRNPLIADLFHRIKFVEKIGFGLKRIKEECKKKGNVGLEIETNGYFILRFMILEKAGEKVPEKVPEKRLQIIIEKMVKNNKITSPELAEELNVNQKTIKRDINKLKKQRKIRRVGPDKGGYWEVI